MSSNLTPSAVNVFKGIVSRGTARAAVLGYPTINIPLNGAPVSGVYAAMVKIGEEEYEAAVFADKKRGVLEAHILDFSKDLYGWNVAVTLSKKIRETKRFADDTSLKKAITEDVLAVRAHFKSVV